MHKEIYDFAVLHQCSPVKNRKMSRIAAYIVLDEDGTYHGIDALDKDSIKSKLVPDLGTFLFTPTRSNPIVENVDCILNKESKKHQFYVDIVKSGAKHCSSLMTINTFLEKFENDTVFHDKVIDDFVSTKLNQDKTVISYRINGNCVEDMDDWNEWLDDCVKSFVGSKKQADTIISSVTGILQTACPSAGGPAIKNVTNKGAFGLGRAAYVASAKHSSYQSYGFDGADCFQMGIDDAETIKAGFEYLLSHEEYYDPNFHCVFFYDKEVENIIKESLTKGIDVEDIDENALNDLEEDVASHKSLLHDILQATYMGVQPRLTDNDAKYYMLGFNVKASGRYYLSDENHGAYNDLIQNLYKWYSDTCIFTGSKLTSITKFYNILLNCVSSCRSDKRFEMVDKELSAVQTMLLDTIYQDRQLPFVLYQRALDHISIDVPSGNSDNNINVKTIYAQIIKCYLIRKGYHIMTEVMNDVNVAYSCGKLFAIYEQMQWKYNHSNGRSKDLNKNLGSSYFTSAMKQPGMTFVQLADLGNTYLNGMDNGSATYFTELIGLVQPEIGTAFPASFNMDERGSFVLGYYQQRASFLKSAKEHNAKNLTVSTVEEKEN